MKQLRKLLWLTQLGISLVTPPLLCIFLAHLAQSKWDWGGWIMAVAIVSGLKRKQRAKSPSPIMTTNSFWPGRGQAPGKG